MELITTAWRGGPPPPTERRGHIRSDDNIETQFPGGPWVPNMPAQLIGSAYHPSAFHGGSVVQQAANYGTEGSLAAWEWTPTFVYSPQYAPHIPQYNLLVPIRWDLQVRTEDDDAVRGQVLVTQVPGQESAQFSQPGTASLTFD